MVKKLMLKAALDCYDDVIRAMTDEGGIVWEDGYTTYQQYAGYYFAFLYGYEHSDNPYYGDEALFAWAKKCWKHYSGLVNEDGQVKIITYNQDWGYGQEEWGFFYWINTYEILRDRLDAQTRAEWNECLGRMFGYMKECIRTDVRSRFSTYPEKLKKHGVENHFVWTILALYRYGQVFNRKDVMDEALEIMHRILDAQHPIGTWLEHEALVLDYGWITASAISLMEIYADDDPSRRAVRKSLDYFQSLTNPDFTKVLAVDVRNRYSKSLNTHGAVSFCQWPDGAAYLQRWAELLSERGGLKKNIHGLSVLCEQLRVFPDDKAVAPDTNPIKPLETRFDDFSLTVKQKGSFVVSFCGRVHKEFFSRFNLDQQGLLGIYAGEALCGGVHSIAQSEFSLFNVVSEGKTHYMHDACKLTDDGAEMQYGGHTCTYRVISWTERELRIEFEARDMEETERAYVNMPFYSLDKKDVSINGGKTIFAKSNIWETLAPGIAIGVNGVECSFDQPCDLRYPVFPFNSYKKIQPRDFADCFTIATVELNENRPSVIFAVKLAQP